MRDYKYAVYIGRFQPFHNGHLDIVKNGLEIAESVIVVVGSTGAASNIRNPWSFDERRWMIDTSIRDATPSRERGSVPSYPNRVYVVGVRDYFYNENTWVSEIQGKVDQIANGSASIALLGSYKDASSYYLKYFPQWEFETVGATGVNASAIRERLFRESFNLDWEDKVPDDQRPAVVELAGSMPVPPPVSKFLQEFVQTSKYTKLCKECEYITNYKASWNSSPFPPIFVTTDAVVVCSGHVLVVKRKRNPGKGLYALPGGFVKNTQKIQDSMLRELKEETRIKLDKIVLESSIVASKVFDHPERSLRGRTITHGYYLKLQDGRLPEVRADDDASEAFWMPLMDVGHSEAMFFEDHASIITYFMGWS